MVKNKLFKLANCAGVILSSVVAASGTPPVNCWYFWKASNTDRGHLRLLFIVVSFDILLTSCNKGKGGTGVDDTSSLRQDGGGTETDGLIDTPEF